MLTSGEARSMFLSQAASLQARVTANQGAMVSVQAAMQHSLALQKQLQVQSAILSMRSQGIENASVMRSFRATCLVRSPQALPAYGDALCCGGSDLGPKFFWANRDPTFVPDTTPLPVELPPMMIRPTFGHVLEVENRHSPPGRHCATWYQNKHPSETHYAAL